MNFTEGEYIYVNKPYRMTSFGALAFVRTRVSRRVGVKRVKIGHAGTLDPLATGVLILCTGKKTKEIERLQLHTKEYTATLQLGATTPSYDMEHEVDATYPTAHITRELILQTLEQFKGDVQQVPPEYSACKIGGDRAYELMRKGPCRLWQGHLHPFLGARHWACLEQWGLSHRSLPYPCGRCPHQRLPHHRRLPRMARPTRNRNNKIKMQYALLTMH